MLLIYLDKLAKCIVHFNKDTRLLFFFFLGHRRFINNCMNPTVYTGALSGFSVHVGSLKTLEL